MSDDTEVVEQGENNNVWNPTDGEALMTKVWDARSCHILRWSVQLSTEEASMQRKTFSLNGYHIYRVAFVTAERVNC